MNDELRRILKQIVRSYGRTILDDPRRCRALLMDFCGECRGEINLVEMALREGVVDALSSMPLNMPRGLQIARLAQRLQDVYYLPQEAAQWAVETCAAALALDLPEGRDRVFDSSVPTSVYVRSWMEAREAWVEVGQTPGRVLLPPDGEVRISAGLDDAAACELAANLASVGAIHQLDLSYSPLTDAGLDPLLNLEGLTTLNLGRTRVGDGALQLIARRTMLRSLNLWAVETITDQGVAALGGCRSLETLELGRCAQMTDVGLRGLRSLPDLVSLGLSATHISDGGLRWVGALAKLHTLDLSGTVLTGHGLAHLNDLHALSSLDLSGCVNLRAASLAALRSLPSLTTLRLGRCGLLTDQALAHLRSTKGLRTLDLEGLALTDASLLYLTACDALTSLNLGWTPITDRGLARLSHLRNLQSLTLAGTQITDAGLSHVAALSDLVHLDLSNTACTDAGLRALTSLERLTSLDLEGTQIHDAGLVHLGALSSLSRLYVGTTAISDVGLELLSRITHLDEIDVTLCPRVTRDGIDLLERQGVVVLS